MNALEGKEVRVASSERLMYLTFYRLCGDGRHVASLNVLWSILHPSFVSNGRG